MARPVLTFGMGSGVKLLSSAAAFLPITQTERERAILLDCMRCIECDVSPADGIRGAAKRKVLLTLSSVHLCYSTDGSLPRRLSVFHIQQQSSDSAFPKQSSFLGNVLRVSSPQCYKHVIPFAKFLVVTCVFKLFCSLLPQS